MSIDPGEVAAFVVEGVSSALEEAARRRDLLLAQAARRRAEGLPFLDQDAPLELLILRPPLPDLRPLVLIGGMGPMAGLEGFVQACEVMGERREIVLYQACGVPRRRSGRSSDAEGQARDQALVEHLCDALILGLGAASGSTALDLIILCNAVHGVADAAFALLQERRPELAVRARWWSLVDATAERVARDGVRTPLLVSTVPTREAELFSKPLRPLVQEVLEPDTEAQELLTRVIFEGVKAGETELTLALGQRLLTLLEANTRRADVLVLACTDIPVFLRWMEEAGLGRPPCAVLDPVRAALDANLEALSGPLQSSIPDRLFETAARQPERLALRTVTRSWTYGALVEEVKARAAALLEALGPEPQPVAVLCDAKGEQIPTLLAVLAAGKFYVPLDLGAPVGRARLILEDAGAVALLSPRGQRTLAESLAPPGCPVLDSEQRGALGGVASPHVFPDSVAYVLYTSGSTGRPKGVAQDHRYVLALVHNYQQTGRFGPQDRFALTSSLAFALSVRDLYCALLNGSELHVFDVPAQGIERLPSWLAQREITVIQSVASLFRRLVPLLRPQQLPALRIVYVGSEAVYASDAALITDHLPAGCELVVVLGSTELSPVRMRVIHAGDVVEPGTVTLDVAVPDSEVLLLDPEGRALGPGEAGEIVVRGPHLSLGYWRRPELTLAALRRDRLGTRRFHSGDQGEWTSTGALRHLGRLDLQLKVRGYRVDPGEVEAALRALPGVREVAVALEPKDQGALLAWVVPLDPGAPPDEAELRRELLLRLPEPMVPTRLMMMDTLPLGPTGKVDRRALPAPALPAWREPSTPTERSLVGIWEQVLGRAVGLDDPLLMLGGSSLDAAQIVASIEAQHGVRLPISAVFVASTVAALSARVDLGEGSPIRPIVARTQGRASPLSPAQRGFWLSERLHGPSTVASISRAWRVRGPLDLDALEAAFQALLRRHEAMTTVFEERGGEPVAVQGAVWAPILEREDLRGVPSPETALAQRLRVALGRPIVISTGPLLRAHVLQIDAEHHVLLVLLHHIVGDDSSMRTLARDLGVLYSAQIEGVPATLPALPVKLGDHAVWINELLPELRARWGPWWREALAGVPETLNLPMDHPADVGFSPAWIPVTVDAVTTRGLRALAAAQGVTLFAATLAAFAVLLGRVSACEDLVVGAPRSQRPPGTEQLIGCFVHALPLRVRWQPGQGFGALLGQLAQELPLALEAGELPFDAIVDLVSPVRRLGNNPIFQVMLSLLEDPLAVPPMRGLEVRPERLNRTTAGSSFDLALSLERAGAELRGKLEFNERRFEAHTARALAVGLEELLRAAVADPGAPLGELPLFGERERRRLLLDWNSTTAPLPELPVHALVEAQVRRRPDALAVTFLGGSLTYAELNTAANRLAWRLRALGLGPEGRVGLALERGPDALIAALAVLKAGGVYVPLDPSYPEARLRWMAQDAQLLLLLTRSDRSPPALPSTLRCDLDRLDLSAEPAEDLPFHSTSDGLAYVVYTSGSTGRPKGVGVSHRGVVRLVTHFRDEQMGPEDRVLQFGPLAFDASTFEMWAPLTVGACLAIYPPGLPNLGELASFIQREGVTVLLLTTALFCQLVEEHAAALRGVRLLMVGGDVVPPVHAGMALREMRGALFNAYGPTETTTIATAYRVQAEDPERGALPIGRPIGNTQLYVLDARGALAPVGVPGELYIGGAGVARGYLGRPGLTAERFVPDPFGPPGGRLYRSGDRVRWRPDGDLEFLGRLDHQVKVRGFRVELGEIESALLAIPGVSAAVVVARHDGPGGARLLAYVVGDNNHSPENLRAALSSSLPGWMVPAAFVTLPALPLSAHGKIDRAALPDPQLEPRSSAPRTPTERTLAAIWTQLLRLDSVGVDDDFFALGGHSLLLTALASRLRAAFGVDLPLGALFEAKTISEQATLLARADGVSAPIPTLSREQRLPLSFAQERLWFLDQLQPGTALYNIALALDLQGVLHTDALHLALGDVVARHEALRTVFRVDEQGPFQVIGAPEAWGWRVVDLLGEADPVAAADRVISQEAVEPFDLSQGPLLRVTLLRLGSEHHRLALTVHHAVSDGWSQGVFLRELSQAYAARSQGQLPSWSALPAQAVDLAAWERQQLAGEALALRLAPWREQLRHPSVLELPTDKPRAPIRGVAGALVPLSLDPQITTAIQTLAQSTASTPFMVLLAAFAAALGRLSGQDDVIVGSPVAGRSHPSTVGSIGLFVNTVALRIDLRGDPSFRELLTRARDVSLFAMQDQDLPFNAVVDAVLRDRDPSRTPLFQAMLALDADPPDPLEIGAVRVERLPPGACTAKCDLTLVLEERDGGLVGGLEYATDLWEPSTIQRWAENLGMLLRGAVLEPERRLSDLPFLTEHERQQLLVQWNDTFKPCPEEPAHARFEAQAKEAPEAVALVFGEQTLSYGQLNAAANRLARRLRTLGVGPERRVGVGLERGLDMIVALLAVLKAGGAYVPLDTSYPEARLRFMAEDAGLLVTLSSSGLKIPSPAGVTLLELDTLDLSLESPEDLPFEGSADNLAYIIYTSGTTGTPKGVAVTHRGLPSLIIGEIQRLRLEASTVALLYTSISFDASVAQIFGPLSAGARLVVATEQERLDASALVVLLERQGVEVAELPPAALPLLEGAELPRLRVLTVGGEACQVAAAARQGSNRRFINAYGPTETTVVATSWEGSAEDVDGELLPIGRPVPNARVLVLDPNGALLPVGVPGELCIGGVGLARGYLGQPGLTAQSFVPDPFGPPGARMYRSGDRVCWRRDGNLHFLGRLDQQVKIRGLRVELGEIEAALLAVPGVKAAVVVARSSGAAGARLVAYLVGEDLPSAASLHQRLAQRLPEWMLPYAFVTLQALPLTPNGKVDRAALPAPEEAPKVIPPRTVTEARLAAIWAEVLEQKSVGVEDDFFAIGGHSLLATVLANRIGQRLGVQVPLQALFERRTVAAQAQLVERGAPVAAAIPVASRAGRLPLSFAQERLWFQEQLQPGTPLYNVPLALELRGSLSVEALRAAFGDLVARHEVLRTVFAADEQGSFQIIGPPEAWSWRVVDLSRVPDTQQEADRVQEQESHAPFDLTRGPLLRVVLLMLGLDHHRLVLNLHHAVFDGWSIDILFSELSQAYAARRQGRPPRWPPLPLQVADVAVWERAQLTNEVMKLRLAPLRDALMHPQVLDLPLDRPRAPMRSGAGAFVPFRVPSEVLTELDHLALSSGATRFMVLLAAFSVLLGRLSGQDDLVLGSPVAGRTRAETEGLVGLFVNTLALRADLRGDPSFYELLRRVRAMCLLAFTHQDLPLDAVVNAVVEGRDSSRTPLFQAMFVLQTASGGAFSMGDLQVQPIPAPARTAKCDLTLVLEERDGALVGGIEYASDLFEAATIERWAESLEVLLCGIAAAPDTRLSALPLLSPSARRQLLVEWNGADAAVPQGTVQSLFEAQARRSPEALALVFEKRTLTYAALNAAANRLAHRLRALGVGPELRVGVGLERGLEMVVALLAVLKAGGAYVPLDPSYPESRLRWMCEDSGLSVMVSSSQLALPAPRGVARLDIDTLDLSQESAEDLPFDGTPDTLAYIIYTSGSTGQPKGVAVPHRGLPSLLIGEQGRLGLHVGTTALQFASVSFDASVPQIFAPLLAGGCVVLASEQERLDAAALVALLDRHGVEVAELPPAALPLLEGAPLPRLRTLTVGGEACQVAAAARHGAHRRFVNMYGPTETTVAATSWEGSAAEVHVEVLPIGRPIPNMRAYVLDPAGALAPVGMPGELYIGGAGLARGYLGHPALTAERFVPDPFGPPGARLYRSGDRARWRADGNLEFLGRLDQQVKIRGFRVELGEVEAALLALPGVRAAAVVARREGPGGARLVAYVVGEGLSQPSALRGALAQRLPDWMVPSAFVTLPSLPLNPAGKLDRAALPAPAREEVSTQVAPRTPAEATLAGIWAELLNLGSVGVDDNFFSLGGDSILSIQVVSRAARAGLRVQLRHLFEAPTVAGLAALAEPILERSLQAPTLAPGEVALTPIQRWLFDQSWPSVEHFNQAVAFSAPSSWTVELLSSALSALIERHDALRLRFVRQEQGWVALYGAALGAPQVEALDVSALPEPAQQEAIRAAADRAQASFELEKPPLMVMLRVVRGGPRVDLIWTIHHLVVDTVSWGILLDDLSQAAEAALAGRAVDLGPSTTPWQTWAAAQKAQVEAGALDGRIAAWEAALRAPVGALPSVGEGAPRLEQAWARLTPAQTEQLLRDAGRAYRTEINDLLLTALALVLEELTGSSTVGLLLEGHGREQSLVPGAELSQTVGWFTSVFPLALALPSVGGLGARIKAVKEQLRAVPDRGASFGMLSWLSPDPELRRRLSLPACGFEVSFNYLGQQHLGERSGPLGASQAPVGQVVALDNPPGSPLELNGVVVEGALAVHVQADSTRLGLGLAQDVARAYEAALVAVIEHAVAAQGGGLTPSDLPLCGLDQAALDRVYAQAPGLEDLLPATPTQLGMLEHALAEPGSGAYQVQAAYELLGQVDEASFEAAFFDLVARHPALRTSLVWEGLQAPLQRILSATPPIWARREVPEDDQIDAAVQALLAEDLQRPFDLSAPSLMRLGWLCGPTRRVFWWVCHHVLLDGWSDSILLGDLLELYQSRVSGVPARLPQPASPRLHAAWLKGQDLAQSRHFWGRTLAPLRQPARLALPAPAVPAPGVVEQTAWLEPEAIAALEGFARGCGVTLPTVMQGAWALILSAVSEGRPVVFGVTGSGRPPELPGIERAVGLFITTLPLVAEIEPEAALLPWLLGLQGQQAQAREHSALPLAEIQSLAPVSGDAALFDTALFDTVLVYESFPIDQRAQEQHAALSFGKRWGFERTHYALSLKVVPGARLGLCLTADTRVLDEHSLKVLGERLQDLLRRMPLRPQARLGELL